MARDLMFQQEIKDSVQQAYGAITGGAGATVARRYYSGQELAQVPEGAIEWALGVGNPVRYARLRPGQTVLDVGSGGGDRHHPGRQAGRTGGACHRPGRPRGDVRARPEPRHPGRGRGLDRVPPGGDGGDPAPRRIGGGGDLQRGAEPVGPQEPGPGRDLPGPGARRPDLHGRPDRGGRAPPEVANDQSAWAG